MKVSHSGEAIFVWYHNLHWWHKFHCGPSRSNIIILYMKLKLIFIWYINNSSSQVRWNIDLIRIYNCYSTFLKTHNLNKSTSWGYKVTEACSSEISLNICQNNNTKTDSTETKLGGLWTFRLLCTQHQTLRFCKVLGISWLVVQLLASQGFSSIGIANSVLYEFISWPLLSNTLNML
jgi:hypothetical protein